MLGTGGTFNEIRGKSGRFAEKVFISVNANPSVIDDSAVFFCALANISVRLTSDTLKLLHPKIIAQFFSHLDTPSFCGVLLLSAVLESSPSRRAHKRSRERERQTDRQGVSVREPDALGSRIHTKRASGNAQYFGFDLLDWLDVHSFQLATCLRESWNSDFVDA